MKRAKKILSLLLCTVMVLGLVPFTAQEAKAAAVDPSGTAYASKADLQTKFDLDGTTTDKTVQKVYFGYDGSGQPQVWKIAGKDTGITGDNIVLFADSPLKRHETFWKDGEGSSGGITYTDGFKPSVTTPNHYGVSHLRNVLKTMATDTNYFSQAQQGQMNKTTITTEDTHNTVNDGGTTRFRTYTTTDVLYAAYGYLDPNNVNSPDGQYITVGTNREIDGSFNNGLKIDRVIDDEIIWGNNITHFWLRTPLYDTSNNRAIVAIMSLSLAGLNVGNTTYSVDVVPAFDLNLTNVLFASAAPAATATEAKILSGNDIMTFRWADTGDKIKSSATWKATEVNITKGTDTGDVFLCVQGNNDGKDWMWSKKVSEISGDKITAQDIAADIKSIETNINNVDLTKCKIWLETTDAADGLTYAKQAEGIKINVPTLAVNTGVVAFAGHEWWVIGNGTSGINPVANTVTLLAKEDEFGDSAFREGDISQLIDAPSKEYEGWWYAEAWVNTPDEYAGSTLQKKMESITSDKKDPHFISSRESALIKARTINDGINGESVSDQKLWALSESEWKKISEDTTYGTNVLQYGAWWWLRSPHSSRHTVAMLGNDDGGSTLAGSLDSKDYAVRPAFNLDLSNVFFASSAEGGKSSASVGGGLVSIAAPTGTVKYTMTDAENQKLTVDAVTKSGSTLYASYSDATVAEANQYISCVLTDSTGEIKYYGKLEQVNSADKASGRVKIPLAEVENGDYTLQIFSEEANGSLYTDFCSEPAKMKVSVAEGTGTVTEFTGKTYGISILPESYTFAEKHAGYSEPPSARQFTITQTGNTPVTNITAAIDTANSNNFVVSEVSGNTFTVQPKDNLEANTYNGTVTISGDNISDKTLSVSFTVTAHNPSSEWTQANDRHYHACSYEGCTEKLNDAACSGGAATYFKKAVCTTCLNEYGSVSVDDVVPTGTVGIDTNPWNKFLEIITFGFYKAPQTVTITVSDDSQDHEGYTDDYAPKAYYYLSETALTKDQLDKNIQSSSWTLYSQPITLNEDKPYIVYVKLVDWKENTSYISSNGITIDTTDPVITGAENNKTYCSDVEITVTDTNLNDVKVGDRTVTVTNNKFTVSSADGPQTITATDKAGNSETITITVNDGHTFTNYVSNNDATCTKDGTKTAKCDYCDETDIVTDTDSALGHSWTVSYDWAEDGSSCLATHICSRNSDHNETAEASIESGITSAATCTAMGQTTYTATFTVEWAEEQQTTLTDVNAIGHDWDKPTYTWEEDGSACSAERVCKNDDQHTENAQATVTSNVTTAATCTEKGKTTYTAAFTETWADEQQTTLTDVAALGHDEETHEAKVPTCTEIGWNEYDTCSRCDYTTYEEIAALGHSYGTEWTNEKDSHWHECSACGDKADAAKHTPKTVNAKEATRTEKGYTGDTVCETCGYEIAKGKVIPVISDPNNPQTGDNSHMALWIALMILSCGGVIGTTVYSKKKRTAKR